MMDKENLGIFLSWRDIEESHNFHVGDEILSCRKKKTYI